MFPAKRSNRPLARSTMIAATLLMLLVPAAHGQDDGGSGGDPYLPSKAEWLCMTLNVKQAVHAAYRSLGDVAVRFTCDDARPDTVEIVLTYPPTLVRRQAVERRAEKAKDFLMEAARRRGWDSWLKVEVRVVED